MVVLVCPNCACRTSVAPFEGTEPCPTCGRPLATSDSLAGDESRFDDEVLVAELRDAFQHNAFSISQGAATAVGPAPSATARAAPAIAVPVLSPGSRLGDFEIIDELGRGGMGIVYRARQLSLDRVVALKVLATGRRRTRQAVRRFRTEAQAAARLHHENIVPVYGRGEDENTLYYSMMLVDGVSLDTVIRDRPELLSSATNRDSFDKLEATPVRPTRLESGLTTTDADTEIHDLTRTKGPAWAPEDYQHIARLIAGVADGLAHAHERGVVHRDIKPHNLLLGSDQKLHITDFGLAYLTDEPHLTLTGEVMGTPVYLSPEQVRGDLKAIDHRTDVYALGVTLYEVLTHRHPFEGAARDEILYRICQTEARSPRRLDPSIPKDLETICLRAIQKNPADRHPTAEVLADDLRRFADRRPILSRRISPLERTVKWARRHKAAAIAGTATLSVVILALILTASITASRRSEARASIGRAYGMLAYQDYKNLEGVRDDIERAAELGTDPVLLGLTRSLAALGVRDDATAIAESREVLDVDPSNNTTRYLLSWALWRSGDQATSREILDEADELGGPQSADAWFFRGMATHYDRPDIAIESYRKAIDLRVARNESYPQAVLHLARAFSQRLYVRRNLDDFSAVEATLKQLIEHNYRDAYPYYLLSIAHRFAGETYQAQAGPLASRNAAEHFEESLLWAREGQRVDPTHKSPVMAEAECLESMALFEEAAAARTRTLQLTEDPIFRWEQLHYRWRLYYWLGRLDEALDDLEGTRPFLPEGSNFAHIYTALVYAEMSERDRALAEVYAIADAAPDDAQAILWTASCLRLLGEAAAANALLEDRVDGVRFDVGLESPQSPEWVASLYRFAAGRESLENLLQLAGASETPWKLLAEAYYYAGVIALGSGDRTAAMEHFAAAHASYDSQQRYTYHAGVLLQKLKMDPDWPPWIHDVSGTLPEKTKGEGDKE